MGLIIRGAQDFTSLPGILHQLDSRYGVTTFNDGTYDRVSLWKDLSGNGNDFTTFVALRNPKYDNQSVYLDGVYCVTTLGAVQCDIYLKSTASKLPYKNLWTTPAKYGIYKIHKQIATGTGDRMFGISLANTNTSQQNFLYYQQAISGGLVGYQRYLRQDAGFYNISGNYASNTLNQNTSWAQFVNGSKEQQRINDAYVLNGTGYKTSAPVYDTTINNVYRSMGSGAQYKLFFEVVYDWSAYTSTEADAFDVQARALLEQLKPSFASLG